MPFHSRPVQMFLNIHLPIVRYRRPLLPDPRSLPQAWRARRRTGTSPVPALAAAPAAPSPVTAPVWPQAAEATINLNHLEA